MSSIYDKIKTPKELVLLVSHQGLSTAQEDICRAQDIFGNAPIEDLVALANDNGRKNDKGEKDPRGGWSSGSDGLSQTFYSVLFHIWNWEDATRFYNEHSNFLLIDKLADLKKTKSDMKLLLHDYESQKETLKAQKSAMEDAAMKISDYKIALEKSDKEKDALVREIILLKAKLYDMITGGK